MDIINFLHWYGFIGVVSFFVLYALYVIVMKYKHIVKDEGINPVLKYILYGVFVMGYLGDILFRILYGTVIFWWHPPHDIDWSSGHKRILNSLTLTEQLQEIRRGETHIKEGSIRRKIADTICLKLLNPWDEGHC